MIHIDISTFISNIHSFLPIRTYDFPWDITTHLKEIIEEIIPTLGEDFNIKDGIAIHKSVQIEKSVTMKGPLIIMENCIISAHTYLREGVFLGKSVKIGPSSEIKNSIIGSGTAIAHLNYIGNSIIGQNVNFEAGSIAANHYNERIDKQIRVLFNHQIIDTGIEKFGALVGDNSRIGANAVLSPGTLLPKNAIVKRLELIEQLEEN